VDGSNPVAGGAKFAIAKMLQSDILFVFVVAAL
jgi:hypothetical protein